MPSDGSAQRLRGESDRLLWLVRRIGELEVEKRREAIGSPRFQTLATTIARLSRDVMYGAIEEERTGHDAERTDQAIDDVTAEDRVRRS